MVPFRRNDYCFVGGGCQFEVLPMLRKLHCTRPGLKHDAKGTCIDVGQARAYEDASTAGTVLKHSQTWHGSCLYCREDILNTLYCLLCLSFLLKGTTAKGSAGAKLSHQVSNVWGQAKLAPWRHCGFVYTAKLKSQSMDLGAGMQFLYR